MTVASTIPPRAPLHALPPTVEMVVEAPRFSWVKPTPSGGVDFVSPLPCPFNYGCAPDHPSGDGDALDVVLLGSRRAAGTRLEVPVRGVVRFIDAGDIDDKLVCSLHEPRAWEWSLVRAFFTVYGPAKGLINRWRAKDGSTRMLVVEVRA